MANEKTYDNTNRGVLFKTKEKKSEKSPDYWGKVNVGGKDYKLSGWIKDTKAGKILSLSVSESKDKEIPF